MGRRPGTSGRRPGTSTVPWGGFLLCLWLLLAWGALPAPAQTKGSLLLWPAAIAYDAGGNLYIADSGRNQVFEATLGGALLVVAGTGVQGYGGDGGAATAAQLNGPGGVAAGPDGTIYIADTGNARIRAVLRGTITTLAGTGQGTFGGDGGLPGAASFRAPGALALEGDGGLLICDAPDHRVRRLRLGIGGRVSTVAGTGVQGYTGDGGAAAAAELDSPEGLAVAGDGRIFIADTHNRRVRAVSAASLITTYAGNGTPGDGGDGGPAVSAQLAEPRGLAVGEDGTLWIADAGNRRLRQVSPGGIITALAGSGTEGTAVDGATLSGAAFRAPRTIAVSTFGFLAVADTPNGSVRLLTDGNTLFQPAALASGRAGSGVEAVVPTTQVYGQLRATVRVTGPVGTPRGAVTLSEAGTPLASGSLAGGYASLAIPMVPVGKHALTTTFGGDGLNPEASGGPFAVTVQPLAITAVANGASAVYGTAPPSITGSLGGVLGSDAGQVDVVFAAAATPLAPVGTYPISATLTGSKSGNYLLSLAPNSGSLQITPAGSLTSLAALAPGYAGVAWRLNAHVDSSTAGQPTGVVQFFDSGSLVATGTLVNGSASGIDAAPSAGAHNLSAVYPGDGNFSMSTSATEVASVNPLPDFTVSLSSGPSAPVAPGSGAIYGLLVSGLPVNGTAAPFTGVVTLSVNGLPLGATATFSPTLVVPGSGSAKVTLTVQTPASLARLPIDGRTGIWIACLSFTCFARYRGKLRLGATLSLVGFSFVLAGCGARTVGEGSGGSTPRSYPLEITGTSTNLLGAVVTHSTTVTLTASQ